MDQERQSQNQLQEDQATLQSLERRLNLHALLRHFFQPKATSLQKPPDQRVNKNAGINNTLRK